MENNKTTNIERIIAKIDNDFNPDNSDWIPRVGAWCIEALSMIGGLQTERKRKVYKVNDRIVNTDCPINDINIKVFDENGCEVKKADKDKCCGCPPSTGEIKQSESAKTAEVTIATSVYKNSQPYGKAPDYLVAETLNADKEWPGRYRVNEYDFADASACKRNYVITGNCQLELNFDTSCVTIEYDAIKTICINNCDMPVIPNNAIVIEAIVNYCMYKMLCRGYKHPVLNLAASQYGTNPYYNWISTKEEARRSIIVNKVDDDDTISKLFRSNFYIATFDSRNR